MASSLGRPTLRRPAACSHRAAPPILFRPRSSRVELPACTRAASVQFRTWAPGSRLLVDALHAPENAGSNPVRSAAARRTSLDRSSNGQDIRFSNEQEHGFHTRARTSCPRHLAARISVFHSEHVGSSPIGGSFSWGPAPPAELALRTGSSRGNCSSRPRHVVSMRMGCELVAG